VYLVVLPDGAAAPTSQQVKDGEDSTGTPLAANLTDLDTLTANVENGAGTFIATGLTGSTAYDVHVVAEGVGGLQASPMVVDVTTLDPIPSFNTINARSVTDTEVDIRAEIDQDGTAYAVVVTDGDTEPTPTEVKNGQSAGGGSPVASDSDALTANVENGAGTFLLTGLAASTAYDIYVTAESSGGLQATNALIEVTTTAGPPPSFNTLSTWFIDDTSVDVRAEIDQNGTVYFVVLPNGATEPTSQQVKDGEDSTGTPQPPNLVNSIVLTANNESSPGAFQATSLTPDTEYDIYVVAEGTVGLQAAPTLLEVTTDPTPPKTYFLSGNSTPAPPYDNPSNAINSLSALKTALGGFTNGDTIEVVNDGVIVETTEFDPEADNITVKSYGTDGNDRTESKPTIQCSAPVLFHPRASKSSNFNVEDIILEPQPGCTQIIKATSGGLNRCIINA